MRYIFSFFDKDSDGVVTLDELRELLKDIRVTNNLDAGISIVNWQECRLLAFY